MIRLAPAAALVLLACALQPAAAQTSTGDACLASARAAVDAAKTPIKPEVPSAPVAMKSLKGQKIWFISPSQATAYALSVSQGVQAAAAAAGIEAQIFDGKAQPALFNEGLSQAVAAKAAAIITYAIDPALVSQSLPQAIAAGIPVIQILTGLPAQAGIYTSINPDVPALGRLQADAALLATQCKLNGAIVYASNFPILIGMKDALVAETKKLCAACQLTEINAQLPTLSTQLGPQTASTMARLPDLNAFIATFDSAAVFMVPAIEQAQRKDVKIVGANGNAANLDFMRQDRVQIYDAAYPPGPYVGWQLIDQAARAATKLPPAAMTLQVQMLDKSNIGPAGAGDAQVFPGLAGYQAAFKKVWGIE